MARVNHLPVIFCLFSFISISFCSSLTQAITNGASILGTLSNPGLPHFLPSALVDGRPWGDATATNTNYYNINNCPYGETRYYDFTISNMTLAPDGVEMQMLVVNGQFPGPTIEANWGDIIQVTVHNDLTEEGTALHWHGFLQQGTPYNDGVPGVTQCPIAPGDSYTYSFRAQLYGTSWYHSHYSAQYAAGLVGPIVIHGPDNAGYDIDLGPVMLTDWFHSYYLDLIEQTMAPLAAGRPPVPTSNNTLINGKMNYNCAAAPELPCTSEAGLSEFRFQSGKKHLLRLINSGAEGLQKFSIDSHVMTVVANDFVPVTPYETNVVTLGVGQRSDIIVEATGQPTDAVFMRATLSASCSAIDGISPEALAIIYYEDADTSVLPQTTTSVTAEQLAICANDPLSQTVPTYAITPDPNPDTVQTVVIDLHGNVTATTGYNLWYMNNSTFRDDYNDPNLLEAKLGNIDAFPADQNVYDFGSNSSVRFVVQTSIPFAAHPMHIHGHNMYVLAEGTGTWDGTITNAANPQRRDVQLLQKAGYIVFQIDMDNPGVWPFHCHIAWHVSAGLYINILEQPHQIRNYHIPSAVTQTCKNWAAFTGGHVPDQIDSGL